MFSKVVPMLCLSGTALVFAAAVPTTAVSAAGAGQADGDEKCSPSGYVLRYRDYAKGWTNTYIRCDVRSGGGNTSDDRPRRSSNNEDRSAGRPEDGDEKCGPDGYVLRYDYNDYLKQGAWRPTFRRCQS